MRPLRLEIEGFTSFRERVVLDFAELNLFAITGPTGAGKSSLIDALVFALYGQVPRVGNEYRQLLSHGKERLCVRLDFSVGKDCYRVARTLRASGSPQTRLERIVGTRVEALADRVKEANQEIERIVGLDYDAFTRAVVLPQGQFDAFLKGEPKERRKILVSLLNLQVYERMQEVVNARAIEARREASFIDEQLRTDYSGASPEALSEKRAELGRAEATRREADATLRRLGAAVAAAQELREARRELDFLEREGRAEQQRERDAASAQVRAASRTEELAGLLVSLEGSLAASEQDAERRAGLQELRPVLRQLAEVGARQQSLKDALKLVSAELVAKNRDAEAAAGRTAVLLKGLVEVEALVLAAREHRETARLQHAAHALRATLKRGEPCPVCEQPVKSIRAAQMPLLDVADAQVEAAEAGLGRAQHALTEAKLAAERSRGVAAGLAAQVSQADELLKRGAEELASLSTSLAKATGGASGAADPARLLEEVERELRALDSARAERGKREAEYRRLRTEEAGLLALGAAEAAKGQAARARREELEGRHEGVARSLATARTRLADMFQEVGLAAIQPEPRRDEAEILESRRMAAQARAVQKAEIVATLGAELAAIERNIARALELARRRQGLDQTATLAQSLALHLRADQFLAYVQEEAMRALAADGSKHLKELSQGRYSLLCEAQEFFVTDHWNADSRRSVKTLSGGETFLASLGLALALAESLVALSAGGPAADALESLFLDEGFGTLDSDALGAVREALEALHDGERMVGLVTHIGELAQELPARVEIGRSPRGATLSVC